jgi:UDP-N-acetylmuramoylalanine-D-glutamate ligase
MVYNDKEPRQLIDNWQQDELESTWLSILLNSKKAHQKFFTDLTTYRNMKNKFQNKEIAAQKLHEVVLFCVKPWKKENQMNDTVETPTIHVDQFNNKAQKAEKEVRPRFEKTAKIVPLMVDPPIRSGTNRYRNMQVIMGCTTVAEAMEKLRALDPSPGGGVDIKIAVKAGAIRLEE